MDDHRLAAWLAERAGALLMALRDMPAPPVAAGYVADQTANAFLLAALAMARPDDPVLSEEGPDDWARSASSRLWIVDPLDGTREYAEGRDDWAVHVALSIDGAAAAGAVARPMRRELAQTGAGARPALRAARSPVIAVSRSRPPARAGALAAQLGATLLLLGSAGAKTMAVLTGEADLYFHEGGQHAWDNCAPAAVAGAAGLRACRVDGAPLRYDRADAAVPDLLIGHGDLVARAIAFLASA